MGELDRWVGRFRLHMAIVLFIRCLVTYLTFGAIAWGIVVLVFRSLIGDDSSSLFWPLVGLFPMVALAAIKAIRQSPSLRQARALLDHHNECGGLLMAGDEVVVGSWEERLPAICPPQIRWKNAKTLGALVASTAFMVMSFLLPVRHSLAEGANRLNVDRDVERISLKIDVLDELRILEPEDTAELRDKLEAVRSEASGNDPVQTWEALDHLEEIAGQAAKKQAEEALTEMDQVSDAAALAEAISGNDALGEERLSEAMLELSDTIAEAMAENEQLREALGDELGQACDNGQLTPQQLDELARALGNIQCDTQASLERLCEAGLIDPETLRLCEGMCNGGDPNALAQLLCESSGLSVAECVANCNRPGRGGITRGRGDAEMTWQQGSDTNDTKFKEIVLQPAAVSSLDQARLVGVSIGHPSVEGPAGASTPGALVGAATGGGSARRQVVLPRHRQSVRRYFQRDE